MKQSQAFATLRAAVVAELLADVNTVLLPNFNSEITEIRTQWEKERPESESLADHRKRARIADLVIRRDQFIEGLNVEMRTKLGKRVLEYKGEINEVTIKDKEGKDKVVLEARFPDGSIARHPRSLWINYKAFERV